MKKTVLALGIVLGCAGAAGFSHSALAQSLLVTGDEDTATEDDAAAAPTDDASSLAMPSEFSSTDQNVSAKSEATGNSDFIQAPDVAGGGREPVQEPKAREPLPKTVDEIISPANLGMTPQEYAKALATIEKEAALHPDAVMESPLFAIEMLKTSEQLSKALDKRVKESCDVSAFTLNVDTNGWSPAARDALRTKALGTIATTIDSICRDNTEKEEIMNSLYGLNVRNESGGAAPQISYENGNFVLAGDFAKMSDDFSVNTLKSQLMSAARKDKEYQRSFEQKIEDTAQKYPDSNKDSNEKENR